MSYPGHFKEVWSTAARWSTLLLMMALSNRVMFTIQYPPRVFVNTCYSIMRVTKELG